MGTQRVFWIWTTKVHHNNFCNVSGYCVYDIWLNGFDMMAPWRIPCVLHCVDGSPFHSKFQDSTSGWGLAYTHASPIVVSHFTHHVVAHGMEKLDFPISGRGTGNQFYIRRDKRRSLLDVNRFIDVSQYCFVVQLEMLPAFQGLDLISLAFNL